MSDHKISLRKQISIFLPLSDWKAIRLEAARQKIPMTELCRRWMKQDMEKLRSRLKCLTRWTGGLNSLFSPLMKDSS